MALYPHPKVRFIGYLLIAALALLVALAVRAGWPEAAPDLIPSRAADVLYLSPVGAPELWRVRADGSEARALTVTGGKLVDFSVIPGGQTILFSARNDQGGSDLWQTSRDGGESTLLLPCAADWCEHPVAAPGGAQIVYSRRQAGALEGEGPGVPKLWTLDRETGATDWLYANPDIGGFEPVWSPDGRWLAFFDGLSGGIRVRSMRQVQDDLFLPSQSGLTGNWGADGQLYYAHVEGSETAPVIQAYALDPDASAEAGRLVQRHLFGESVVPEDFSPPVLAPGGAWAAVALRPLNGGPTKQIWLLKLDGSAREPVTEEPRYHHAALSWEPSGDRLLFQRLEGGGSDARPQVAVWDGERTQVLAEDAYQPQWLP